MLHKDTEIRISDGVMRVWQDFLDVIAEITEVPVALIMRLEEPYISVFLSSHGENNPYKPHDKEHFKDSGLYCERVIQTKSKLLVPNALKDANWDHNPDIKLGMISYLGYPIMRPDGEPFGTLCILDNKENAYNPKTEKLMEHYRNMIQRELALEYLNQLLGHENSSLSDIVADLKEKNETILRNTTELQSLNTVLHSKIETLNWLIKVISHDLRGPLGSFRDLLKMMLEEDIPAADQREYLTTLHERSGQMTGIVNEMLDGIKEQGSKLEDLLDIHSQNIVPVFKSIYELYRPMAAQKGVYLEFHPESSSILAPVDKDLLKIAVRNLLNNAVHFTSSGGKICLRLRALGTGAEISVSDDGIGIKSTELNSLLEGLEQQGKVQDHDPGVSHGFGLKLCRDSVKRMNGKLEIVSESGRGARFIIRIPA